MLFNSLQYAIFLPIVFAFYWILPHRYRWALLLVSSYYFYMSWNAKYVFLILFTTIVSYVSAIALEKHTKDIKTKKVIVSISAIACLGILFVFKYFDFFFSVLSGTLGVFSIHIHSVTLDLLLPVGISFYTFQTLSYVIDVYRGDVPAEHHFGIYATFVSFFPQLVAGPIERTQNLLPQIKSEKTFNYDGATYGIKLMAWGFFKKMVIADNLAVIVDKVYNQVYSFKGFPLVVATVFFTIQIYCDFSGYSDIAKGTAKLMGIDLMDNFKSPYYAASLKEFWSRWHISLSSWFRDYLYIPLGGNRKGKLREYLNVMITFLASGLWHGASLTFLAWGALHGVGQVIENLLGLNKKTKKEGVRWMLRVVPVLIFVTFAWIFFRAQNMREAIYVLTNMFSGIQNIGNYIHIGLIDLELSKSVVLKIAILYLAPLFVYDYVSMKKDVIRCISKRHIVVRFLIYVTAVVVILTFRATAEACFVYFQF